MMKKVLPNTIFPKKNGAGFTLIEMMMAVTMFAIIVAAISGLFISGIRSQRRVLATQEILDQTSYVIEYMSRALRMAKKDDSSGSCTGTPYLNYVKTESGNGIRFLNYQTKCQEFRLNTTTSQLQEVKSIDRSFGNFALPWTDLTSDKLKVISFNIGPDASWDQDDDDQPRATIFLEIESGRPIITGSPPKIQIQTSISQRSLDVEY